MYVVRNRANIARDQGDGPSVINTRGLQALELYRVLTYYTG